LSQYELLIGLALVVLTAALVAAIIFRKRGLAPRRSTHSDYYVTYSDFDRALGTLRREFERSFDNAQTAATNASTTGDKIIAAIKPIASALQDLNTRLANLERRTNYLSEMPSEPAGDNLYLESFERRLAEVADRISSLEQIIDEVRQQEGDRNSLIEAIDSGLTVIQSKIDSFGPRLDHGENRQGDLSNLTSSLVNSLTSLKGSSEETVRRIADLERRFVAKAEELKSRLSSFPGPDHLHALVSAESERSKVNNGTFSEDGNQNDIEQSGASGPAHTQTASRSDEDGSQTEYTGADGRLIAPEGRGGGSRGPRETTKHTDTLSEKAPQTKSELVATRGSGDWQIFVDVESLDPTKIRVLQGNDCLLNTSNALQFGPLRDLTTPLQILCDGVKVAEKELLTNTSPILYFRFHNQFAREVRRLSRGLTLAIVPDQWEYDEGKSGLSPIESEAIDIPGYRVHFISADTGATTLFNRPGEKPFEVTSSNPRFLLTGHRLPDAEEAMGPLFGGELPLLGADKDEDWAKVHTIVVGVEGRGPGRWRDKCKLNGSGSGDWQERVRPQGSGWYFVRLYDSDDDLIDSLDFRYVKGLKRIETVRGEQALNREHVFIEFVHDENVSVNFTEETPHLPHRSVRPGTSTVFSWPIDPHFAKVRFAVCEGEQDVRVSLDTDRIWWALATGSHAQAPDWQLSGIELDRDDFAPMSTAALLFRFPHQAKLGASIGFERSDRRELVFKLGESMVPLNAFGDSIDGEKFGRQNLKLWISESGSELEFVIASLSIPHKCQWCESWVNGQEEMLEHVMSQHS
jgi:predicted  nucleic acid-binding Zn-ribbon protein